MKPDAQPDDPTPGMHIWGWMSPAELRWLMAQAAQMKSVVEIGSLHGRSAFALLTACPGPVYCIDPWDDEHDLSYGSFMGNCGHFPNLVAIRGRSLEVVTRLPIAERAGDGFDMVFIDGDHEYESVIADIRAWLPYTRKLICGHDYQNDGGGFPGVAKAVHEMFGEPQEVIKSDDDLTSIWAVYVEGWEL